MGRIDRNEPAAGPGLPPLEGAEPPPGSALRNSPGPQQTPAHPSARDGFDAQPASSPLFTPARATFPFTPPSPVDGLSEELDELLRLSRAGGQIGVGQTTGGTGTATASSTAAGAAGAAADPSQIATQRDAIKLGHRQSDATVHNPWEMNRLAPKNTASKIANYRELVAAEKKLTAAVAGEKLAQESLSQAQRRHAAAPSAQTAAAVATAEAKLTSATAARTSAEAAVAKQDQELRAALKAQSPSKAAEIDALDFTGRSHTRDEFDVTVGTTVVHLENAVDSYATVDAQGLVGSANGDSKAVVSAAIDRSSYSDSVKHVFKGVSANEGTFSTINGYDSKGLTFGFIQMAGGGSGETLSSLLASFKRQDPQAFADLLGKYGIDVERGPRGPELVLHQPDGSVLRGGEAARKIGSDAKLAGALAASGLHPDMQECQLRFAKDYLDQQRRQLIEVDGQQVAISDLITSERGNGLLFDRSVHAGLKGARDVLTAVATAYLQQHPGAKLDDETVRAAIETGYIAAISGEKALAGRCANIAAHTVATRGSYVE